MRAAEEAEFREWAGARQAALRRTAFLLCGDWHRAEDLVQETLTKMYRRWPQLVRRDAIEAYARRVLANAHIDDRRRRSAGEVSIAILPGEGDDATTMFSGAPGDLDDRTALRVTMLTALKRMPPSQRAVLVLRYWEDLTQAQTAEILGCSEGNVKSQASRGLKALRLELQRIGVELAHTVDEAVEEPPDGPGGATHVLRTLREAGRRRPVPGQALATPPASGLATAISEALGALTKPGVLTTPAGGAGAAAAVAS